METFEVIMLFAILVVMGFIIFEKYRQSSKQIIKDARGTDEFNELFWNLKKEHKWILESKRQKIIRGNILAVLGYILVNILFILFCSILGASELAILAMPIFVGYWFGVGRYVLLKNYKDYNDYFEENILKKIVYTIAPNMFYSKKNEIKRDKMILMEFKFMSKYTTGRSFSDYVRGNWIIKNYIEGYVDTLKLEICNALINHRSYSSSGSSATRYKGLFSYSETTQHIPCEVRILNNQILYINNRKIHFDNLEFSQKFVVLCENEALVSKIFTPKLMEDLIEIYNINIDFEIIIKDNKVNIKYDVGDIFKPKRNRDVLSSDTLLAFYLVIKFVININKRINEAITEIEI